MGGTWTLGGIWALRLVIMMSAIRISGGLFSPSSPEVPRYHAPPCPRLMWPAGKLASAEQKGGVEMAFQAPVVCDDVLALRMRGGSGADGQDIGGGWFEFRDASTGNAYYHNPSTGATQWEPPAVLSSPPTTTTAATIRNAAAAGAESAQRSTGRPSGASDVRLAGLNLFDKEHTQVLKGYVGGMINDALDAATAPMEKVMDGLIGIGGKIFAGESTASGGLMEFNLTMGGCNHANEEWHVAQGYNERDEFYTMFRHRRYGTSIELWGKSDGGFNFQTHDHAVVRHVYSITEYHIENRDWIMHPELLDELRGKSDTDMYCLQRVPFVDGRKWKGHVVHNSILVEHKSQYDKNNVSLHLLPDGFIYFPRGNTCDLEEYRTRTAIVVRQGKEYSAVPVEDAKRLLVALSGPVRDLTHFLTAHGASDRVPSSYNHLLEEGERISGHDKTLEEVWSFRGGRWRVLWDLQFSSWQILAIDE